MRFHVTFGDSDWPGSVFSEFTNENFTEQQEKPKSNFCIIFSNPQAIYHPGTSVAGTAHLDLKEPIKARSVSIKFDGRAYTKWTKPRSKIVRGANGEMETKNYTLDYYAKTTYADDYILAWKAPSNNQVMPAGSYNFPFSFQVPSNCPPSFESNLGYIRYTIKLELDRPWQFNKTDEKVFTVSPTFDLNTAPQAAIPIEGMAVKNLGIILFRNGKVTMEYNVAKTGFVPAEMIVINVQISNESTKSVVKAKATLIEQSSYLAYESGKTVKPGSFIKKEGDHRSITTRIASVEQELSIKENSKGNAQLHLQVPPTVPSFNTCPIITVDYLLEIKLETNGILNSDVEATCPVLIGTIPVRLPSTPVQPSAPPMDSPTASVVEPTAPPLESPDSGADTKENTLYPILPRYEESVGGVDGTVPDAHESEAFIPRHPFYPSLSEDLKKATDP